VRVVSLVQVICEPTYTSNDFATSLLYQNLCGFAGILAGLTFAGVVLIFAIPTQDPESGRTPSAAQQPLTLAREEPRLAPEVSAPPLHTSQVAAEERRHVKGRAIGLRCMILAFVLLVVDAFMYANASSQDLSDYGSVTAASFVRQASGISAALVLALAVGLLLLAITWLVDAHGDSSAGDIRRTARWSFKLVMVLGLVFVLAALADVARSKAGDGWWTGDAIPVVSLCAGLVAVSVDYLNRRLRHPIWSESAIRLTRTLRCVAAAAVVAIVGFCVVTTVDVKTPWAKTGNWCNPDVHHGTIPLAALVVGGVYVFALVLGVVTLTLALPAPAVSPGEASEEERGRWRWKAPVAAAADNDVMVDTARDRPSDRTGMTGVSDDEVAGKAEGGEVVPDDDTPA
jgi:hypothetical protein